MLGFVTPLIGLGGVLLSRHHARRASFTIWMVVFEPLLSIAVLSIAVAMAMGRQASDAALLACDAPDERPRNRELTPGKTAASSAGIGVARNHDPVLTG